MAGRAGAIYVLYGRTILTQARDGVLSLEEHADLTLLGGEPCEGLGISLAPVGDLDGDGTTDLAFGTRHGEYRLDVDCGMNYFKRQGHAYVLLGAAPRAAN